MHTMGKVESLLHLAVVVIHPIVYSHRISMTMSIASLADQMHLEEVYHLVKELGNTEFLLGRTNIQTH